MIIKNSRELAELTGSFYASNDFSKIRTDIELETEAIVKLISAEVYAKAKASYVQPTEANPTPEQPPLVRHVQLPIALMAGFRYMQSNMVTHSDNGRKVKVNDKGEKMAWAWMIEADDRAQLRKAQVSIDRLLNFLEQTPIQEWMDSDARKESRSLFINSTEAFQRVFPIDHSPRFFYTVLPFLRTIQNTQIKPAMGSDYEIILTEWMAGGEMSPKNGQILQLIQQAMPLLTMAMAAQRLSLEVMPDSVVQNFRTHAQSLKSSEPALDSAIKRFRHDMLDEGMETLDKAKQLRTGDDTKVEYLPKNDQCNKFMRT